MLMANFIITKICQRQFQTKSVYQCFTVVSIERTVEEGNSISNLHYHRAIMSIVETPKTQGAALG